MTTNEVTRLKRAIAAGASNRNQLARKTGIPYSRVCSLLEERDIYLPKSNRSRHKRKTEQSIEEKAVLGPPIELFYTEEIRKRAEQRSRSISSLAHELEIPTRQVENLAAKAGVTLVSKYKETVEQLRQCSENGITPYETHRAIEYSILYINKIARKEGLVFKSGPSQPLSAKWLLKRLHELPVENRMRHLRILRGLSLEAIAQPEGLTRESIRQYIVDNELHPYWKIRREKYKRMKNKKEDILREKQSALLACLRERALNTASTWAEQRAVHYILSRQYKSDNLKAKQIVKLFAAYERAEQRGTKPSFKKLGKATSMDNTSAKRILNEVGLHSLNWEREYRPRTTAEERRAIEEVYLSSPLSTDDIVYFTGREGITNTVCQGVKKKEAAVLPRFERSHGRGRHMKMTYARAAQIYEAEDLGFSQPEIAELYELPEALVQYAQTQRASIEPVIRTALQKLHPERNSARPSL